MASTFRRSPRRVPDEATKLETDTLRLEREAKEKEMKLASIRAALARENRLREDISKEAKSKGWWSLPQKHKPGELFKAKIKTLSDVKTSRSASACSQKSSSGSQDLSLDDGKFKRASDMLLSSFGDSGTGTTTAPLCPIESRNPVEVEPLAKQLQEDLTCMGSQTEKISLPVEQPAPPPSSKPQQKTYFDHLLAQARTMPRRSACFSTPLLLKEDSPEE